MALPPGSRLGPYEVMAALGAGGMGEVYRARDTRLGREVALKVLRDGLAGDPEQKARFEREARAASALEHPNIVGVHDLGSDGTTFWMALELVEGQTLRELMRAGGLPVRRALEIGSQLADGLARAHEAGVVHRDLKPENVMVTADGFVKVLDFGLAKVTVPAEGGSREGSTSPFLATASGMVLGTVGYMSPEQAAGRPADFRSDQFSLGVILHELLSGQRAFRRETPAETLTAILREPAQPLGAEVPAPLRWIVERCLAKEPEERYAATRDLAHELRSLREHLSEAAPEPPRRRLLQGMLSAAGGLVMGAPLAWVAGHAVGRRSGPPRGHFRRLTFRRGSISSARFGPDDGSVIYGAAWEGEPLSLHAGRTDSPEFRELGLEADVLAVSSRGELALSLERHSVFAFESIGTLARMPLAGGGPRSVLEDVEDADLARDGSRLAVVREAGGRRRLEFPVGTVLFETSGTITSPRIAPQGDRLAFLHHPVRGDNGGLVCLIEAGRQRELSGPWSALSGLGWRADGSELVFAGSRSGNYLELHAQPLSGAPPRLLLAMPGRVGLFDVGRDGRMLLNRQSWSREIRGRPPDGSEHALSWLDWSLPTDLSADGRKLVIVEQGEGAGQEYAIYLRPTDGGPAVRLGEGRGGALSPDGEQVLAAVGPTGRAGSLALVPTGAGESRTLPGEPRTYQGVAWLPAGDTVLFAASGEGQPVRIHLQDLKGGVARPVSPPDFTFNIASAAAPDGRSAVVRGPDRRPWVLPFSGGEPHPIPGVRQDETASRWTADGRAVFVYTPSRVPALLERLDVESGQRTPVLDLSPPDPAGVAGIGPVLLTADASAYVYSYRRLLGDLYVVEGLG